jgi:hypothetical protein
MKKLIGIFAVVGAIKWTILMGGLIVLMKIGHGLGDGAGSGSSNSLLTDILIVGVLWLFPVIAFIFVTLISFNRIKDHVLKVGYWYSVAVLFILGILMIVFTKEFPFYPFCVIVGCGLFLFTTLFGFFCFPNSNANGSQNLGP